MIGHRLLNRRNNISERSEMKDPVDGFKVAPDRLRVRHILDPDGQPAVVFQMLQVLGSTGGQIIKHDHLMAVPQQTLDQMAADETGAAGYQSFPWLFNHVRHLTNLLINKTITVDKGRVMTA
jgi:hypothetical protein